MQGEGEVLWRLETALGGPCELLALTREALIAAEARGYERGHAEGARFIREGPYEQDAFDRGYERGIEDAAKEADYYAKNSSTARNIAAAIRSLKPKGRT